MRWRPLKLGEYPEDKGHRLCKENCNEVDGKREGGSDNSQQIGARGLFS